MVKTGRNEVKPTIPPSSDLGVSSGSKKKLDGEKKVKVNLMLNVYMV
jgi:hypothetical protein